MNVATNLAFYALLAALAGSIIYELPNAMDRELAYREARYAEYCEQFHYGYCDQLSLAGHP